MKTNFFSILLIYLLTNYSFGQTLSIVDYVNPLMGSDSN